jgi:hypothetical protein
MSNSLSNLQQAIKVRTHAHLAHSRHLTRTVGTLGSRGTHDSYTGGYKGGTR